MGTNEDYYIVGREFYEKWFQARPASPETIEAYKQKKQRERFEKLIEQSDELQEFVDDIESTGAAPEFVQTFKKSLNKLNRFKVAAEFGIEAAKAAEEVEDLLIQWYNKAYSECEEKHGGKNDDYWECVAHVDRKYQARNVDWVLNINREDSWVNKTLKKWKSKLLKMFTPGT